MRQAGRYLPQYRQVKKNYSFERICKTSSLAAEVTAQPVEILDFDAAIVFSDILFILEALGINLKYRPGPVITPLLEEPGQIDGFRKFNPSDKLAFVGEALVESRRRLGDDVALLGFCGAPFTLFCYLCGAGRTARLSRAIDFLEKYPRHSETLLDLLADLSADYLIMQFRAGADTVQIFDTWAGGLSPGQFVRWSFPYLKKIIVRLKNTTKPVSVFIRDSYHLLDKIAELDNDIFSVDWKTPMEKAVSRLKPKVLQGNLDPRSLLCDKNTIVEKAGEIMKTMDGYPGFIFNLGHGILPETPVDNVRTLVQAVHEFKRKKDQ
jgi:uroporphyrinogen decarboxylase